MVGRTEALVEVAVDSLSSRELDLVRETIWSVEVAIVTLSASERIVGGEAGVSTGVAISFLASREFDLVGEEESLRGVAVDALRSRDFGLVGEKAIDSLPSRGESAVWASMVRADVGNGLIAELQRRWVALTESRSPGELVASIKRSV